MNKLLFFGSDHLAVQVLKYISTKIPRIEVVTPPDRLFGRGSQKKLTPCPVKSTAITLGLKSHDAPFTAPRAALNEWINIIELSKNFDAALVFSFGYFLPFELISTFPLGAINIHPSLLPKYRGASPIQHALLNGDKETGVSIIDIHPYKFDHGRILKQINYELDENSTYSKVSTELVSLGEKAAFDVLSNLRQYQATSFEQTDVGGSKARKLHLKDRIIENWNDSKLNWNKYRAFEVLICHIKSLTASSSSSNMLFLYDILPPVAVLTSTKTPSTPGDCYLSNDKQCLFIKIGEYWFPCQKIQIEGKKIMSANEFYNGYLLRRSKNEDGVILSKVFL